MFTKSCFFALLFLIPAFTLSAQREETILGERGWGFSGIWGGYNHQYTQYGNTDGFNRGGFFGFEFGKSLNIGWSHFNLQDDITLKGADNQRFDFKYNGAKLGYAFLPYKAIHPVLNFEVGRGEAKLAGEGADRMLVMQPSVGLEINVFRWFRLGIDGGYRIVQNNDLTGISTEDLSGLYGQATLKFGLSWGRFHKRDCVRKERYED